jgi:DNA-directed RNA polymerase specialized sigma24 family protein
MKSEVARERRDSCEGETMDDDDEELAGLLQSVSGLSPECKRVLTLRKVYGWRQDRIALYLGIEGQVVEGHLRSCVQSISRFYETETTTS